MLPFNLSQGQPLTVTLKSTLYWNLKKKVFKPATVENVFFDFFPLVQIKNSFVHFGKKKKNIKQILISNFLFVDCSFMYTEGSTNFKKY